VYLINIIGQSVRFWKYAVADLLLSAIKAALNYEVNEKN
jgi:hypothetical protein